MINLDTLKDTHVQKHGIDIVHALYWMSFVSSIFLYLPLRFDTLYLKINPQNALTILVPILGGVVLLYGIIAVLFLNKLTHTEDKSLFEISSKLIREDVNSRSSMILFGVALFFVGVVSNTAYIGAISLISIGAIGNGFVNSIKTNYIDAP